MNIGVIVAAVLISLAIGAIIGVIYRKKIAESKVGNAEEEAKRIVNMARIEAENLKKEEIIKAKEEIMASRKELKKNINYIAGELFTECLVNSLYVPGTDKQKADELMAEILKMQDEFISRISHTEPGNVKGFYKKLRADFNAKVDEIIDAMGKLK